jgi:hypothetical protein
MSHLSRKKFVIGAIICAAFFLLSLWLTDPSLAAAPGRFVNGASAWKPIGPPGGNFNRLAVNARNPREAFALTSSSQLFRTTNGGQSWSLVAFFDSSYSNGVALDPFDAGVIYLPVFRNIQISKDHGATWTAHFLGMSCQADGPISVHPLDPKLIYASGRTIYNKKPQKRCMALFISKDGGTTWSVSDISPTGSDGSNEQPGRLCLGFQRKQIRHL